MEERLGPTFFREGADLGPLVTLAFYTHLDKQGASRELIENWEEWEHWEDAVEAVGATLSPMGQDEVIKTLVPNAAENAFSPLLSEPIRLCLAGQVWCVRGHSYDIWNDIDQAVSTGSTREDALALIEPDRCHRVDAYTEAARLYTLAAAVYAQKGRDADASSAGVTAGKIYMFLAGTHLGTDRLDSATRAFFMAEGVFRKAGQPQLADDARNKALATDKKVVAADKKAVAAGIETSDLYERPTPAA
ncbi:hypothetical protein [Pandoraea sputorum]|uniref:hypothetical protein n=1 Tax=Pandoraea sputorum TaxID=93222 RepID=UPI0012425C57|nr:hypothetical protein [Pandoraea sputorum]